MQWQRGHLEPGGKAKYGPWYFGRCEDREELQASVGDGATWLSGACLSAGQGCEDKDLKPHGDLDRALMKLRRCSPVCWVSQCSSLKLVASLTRSRWWWWAGWGGVPANSWNPTQISLHVCEKTEKEMKQVAKSVETWTAASGHGAIGFCFSVSLTFMFIGLLWVPFPPVWARTVLALFPQLVYGMVGSWIA